MPVRIRDLIRDYAALSGSEAVSKLAGFVAFAYLARVLEPGDYGTVELAVALGMFGMLVVDFGLGPIGAREIAKRPEEAARLAREIPALRVVLAFAGAAVMALGAVAVGRADALPLVALFAVALFAIPWTLNWLLQGLDLTRWVGPAQMLRMLVFAGGLVLFVGGPEDVLRVGLVEIAGAAAMAVYYAVAARAAARPVPRFDARAMWRLAREAAPVGAGQLCWAVSQFGPTIVVASLLASEQVAFFGAAHRILLGLGSFVFLYYFNLYPSLVRSIEAGRADFEATSAGSFQLLAWLGVGVALVGTLLAGPLCTWVYGARFAAAGSALELLVWTLPISMLSGHARFALIGSGHQRREMIAEVAGAATTFGGCWVLIPMFGIRGAALAMGISALVVWGVAHRSAVRHVGALPTILPLLRVGAVGAVAIGVSLGVEVGVGVGVESPWMNALVAGGVYVTGAVVTEARTLRGLLVRRAARTHESHPAHASEGGPPR